MFTRCIQKNYHVLTKTFAGLMPHDLKDIESQ